MIARKTLVAFFILAFFPLFLVAVLSPIIFGSLSSSEGWVQTYEVNNHFYAESFIQASDGGFVIAGSIDSAGPLILKTDSHGNMVWNQTYEGTYNDAAYCLVETSDGGYTLISSETQLIKFDANGNMEWNRTLTGGHRAYSLIQSNDGGFVVAGVSGDVAQREEPYFWLVKTDEQGYTTWNKTYETITTGSAASVTQTIDGGFALLGSNSFNPDFLLVKTDSSGALEWSKRYEKQDNDFGRSIIQNSDGGYTLAGTLWNRSGTGHGGLIKTDSNGNMLWMKNYPGGSLLLMAVASDGGYVLCSNLTLFKIDSDGNTLWTKDLHLFPESSHALEHSLIQTLDGGYAILGGGAFDVSDDQPMGKGKVWIIKTDPEGIIPEFPSWTILPLLVLTIIVAIFYRKKMHRTQIQQSY